ncbi:MAG: trypsin-like peptidase domain-containing protein [Gemmataceae bacterium]
MKSTLFTLLAFLTTQAPPEISIQGETLVKPHRLVRLQARGHASGSILIWDVSPEEACDVEEMGDRLVLSAPPGTYRVRLRVLQLREGAAQQQSARVVVTIRADDGKPAPPSTERPDPVGATGRLRFGNAGCTATLIGPRRDDGRWDVLTAAHCTGAVGSTGTLRLSDGRTLSVTVTARDTQADLAWLVTERVEGTLPHAVLARSVPAEGTAVWHQGFGVDRPGNRETGRILATASPRGQLALRLSVSSGDSGSGIFREDTGELVAVVCCTSGSTTYAGSSVSALSLKPR